jgi:hypothetical protein
MSSVQFASVLAGLVFRANVWAIRGNVVTPDDDLAVVETDEP